MNILELQFRIAQLEHLLRCSRIAECITVIGLSAILIAMLYDDLKHNK